jgi:hypothetical protein
MFSDWGDDQYAQGSYGEYDDMSVSKTLLKDMTGGYTAITPEASLRSAQQGIPANYRYPDKCPKEFPGPQHYTMRKTSIDNRLGLAQTYGDDTSDAVNATGYRPVINDEFGGDYYTPRMGALDASRTVFPARPLSGGLNADQPMTSAAGDSKTENMTSTPSSIKVTMPFGDNMSLIILFFFCVLIYLCIVIERGIAGVQKTVDHILLQRQG